MMTNKTIINELILNYENLTNSNLEIVLNEIEWKNLSDAKINLIFVAENPGQKEKENDRYLHGPAGKYGRKFIENYYKLNKQKGQFLILNKTPFYSNKSIDLKDQNNIVKNSVAFTFNALHDFWSLNKGVHIVIAGFSKAIMNNYFFEFYSECLNDQFKRCLFFVNHPSYRHLDTQFANCLVEEITTKRRILIKNVLTKMKKISALSISENFKLKII